MADATWDEAELSAERLVKQARERRAQTLLGRERLVAWATTLLFLGAAVPLATLASTTRSQAIFAVAVLAALYAVLSRVEYEVGSVSVVPSELAFIPILALLPARDVPLCVAAGLLAGHLPDMLRGRIHPHRVAQLIGSAWFSLGPAIFILAVGEPDATLDAIPLYTAALGIQLATDAVVTAAREYLASGISPRLLLRPVAWVCLVDGLLFPLGLLAAIAGTANPAAALLVTPVAVLMFVFSRQHKAHLDSLLALSSTYRGTAFLLGDIIEADNAYTGSHSREVVDLVLAVSERLELSAAERRTAEFAALLHDIGKLRMPSEIINKPAPLTKEERDLIETHTIEGQQLLERVGGSLAEVGKVVRSSHEHYDGRGYPDALAGNEIPLVSRIVACCDAYSAMTTSRPYRPAMSQLEAITELKRCSGTQFDPHVVEHLLAILVAQSDQDNPLATETPQAA